MSQKNQSSKKSRRPLISKFLIILACTVGLALIAAYPIYLAGQVAFYRYFNSWGAKLVDLEKRGLLSKKIGAAWQDVLKDEAMEREANALIGADSSAKKDAALLVNGVFVNALSPK